MVHEVPEERRERWSGSNSPKGPHISSDQYILRNPYDNPFWHHKRTHRGLAVLMVRAVRLTTQDIP